MNNSNTRRRALARLSKISLIGLGLTQLPKDWMRPVVEAVVLPVHAQTSSGCTLALTAGDWSFVGRETGGTNSTPVPVSLNANGTGVITVNNTTVSLNWSVSGSTFSATGSGGNISLTLSSTLASDCASMTGTFVQTGGGGQGSSGTFTGTRL